MPRILLLLLIITPTSALHAAASRLIEFSYQTTITPVSGAGNTQIFLPLAAENDQQKIVSQRIDSPIAGKTQVESVYGNRYWHAVLENSERPVTITITSVIQRLQHNAVDNSGRNNLSLFLKSNQKVVVDHPILMPIRTEIEADLTARQPAALSRAIYDWVVDNVEYKKVGTGWGNGDTFWACNERYGNCTDFHALHISLARSYDIPARFEFGFPLPSDRNQGSIGGYHCWVQFYDEQSGWFPIDASEAAKHPEKREYFYGSHPTDRIHFTTGRDLQLGPHHQTPALNYFIYPHVEQGGQAFEGQIEKEFNYRCLSGCSIE